MKKLIIKVLSFPDPNQFRLKTSCIAGLCVRYMCAVCVLYVCCVCVCMCVHVDLYHCKTTPTSENRIRSYSQPKLSRYVDSFKNNLKQLFHFLAFKHSSALTSSIVATYEERCFLCLMAIKVLSSIYTTFKEVCLYNRLNQQISFATFLHN